MQKRVFWFCGLLTILTVFGLFSCKGGSGKEKLVIFHAGSLSIPLGIMAEEFTQRYPDVRVEMEAAGSVTCVRKITDLDRSCDILAIADIDLIDEWMIPNYADWSLGFASNEICLVYTPESPMSENIDITNWFDIIAMEDVRYGRSDPDSDPCGYRTIMSLKLANIYYPDEIDVDGLLRKDKKYIRPKASDLLALLETKTIDYFFAYTSVALQHGLSYLSFPDSINLSNPDYHELYKKVSVDIAGSKPGTKLNIQAAPIVYGLTIPTVSQNSDVAKKFLKYIIDPEGGMRVLEKYGQKIIVPAFSEESTKYPDI